MEVSTLLDVVIAVSVVLIAAVQVGIVVYGARLASRVNRLVNQLEHEIQPALRRVNDVSGDVSRVTTLAVAQLERVDQMTAQLAERCERMISVGQEALVDPLRQGVALLHGLRVAIGALRDAAGDSRRAPAESEGRVSDDQEALFIG